MIKAIFFDFYDTIVDLDPPRQELQARACREYGIEINHSNIPYGYFHANNFLSKENARHSIQKRTLKQLQNFWAEYEVIVLKFAGVDVPHDLALRIFTRMRELDRRFILFDDVLPVIKLLRQRNIIIGLISNLNRTLDAYCDTLGLTPYVSFTVVSYEVGEEKPHPKIFRTALERAGVEASETIHVGDQYESDVVGARGVGITPILLDRGRFWGHVNDCTRIRTLSEVIDLVDAR